MSDEPLSRPEAAPGEEEMLIASPAAAEVPTADCSLLVDVGSAWTKASLVAHANGRWRVVAHAAQPSDWPRAELVRSLAAALRPNADPAFADHLETLIADGARIVCRTPARPGRIALAAVAHDVSAAAARQAAESAGWLVVEEATADDGRSLVVRLEALRDADPDAWLVVGGFDDGDPAPALELAALAAAARGPDAEAPLVWAGSSAGETAVRELVGERLQVAPNASPRPGVRDPEALRAHLETLLQGMVEPRGVRRLAPIAFRRAIGAVARGTGLTVVGVDLGARYATWVRADAAGGLAGRVFAAGGIASGQLVAGGMASRVGRHLAHAIDDLAVADVLQNLRTRPAALPQTEDELAITQAAARVRLEQMTTQEGGIEGVDLVVAAGRTLAAAPTPSQAMAMLLDGLRPVGVTQLAIDPADVLGPLGSLEDGELEDALTAILGDALIPLGSAVVCRGVRAGQTAMRIAVRRAGWHEEQLVVRAGAIVRHPLPRGARAELEIELAAGVSLGGARRSSGVRAEVTGGAAGLVFDARDVPTSLPRRTDDRRAVLAGWRDAFALDPEPPR